MLIGRCLGITLALVLAACSSGHSRRQVHPDPGADGGTDGGADGGLHSSSLNYFGSTGSSGGQVMKGGKYILFSITGEVPGTSGLTKSPNNRMVGGVVGRASY